MTLDLSIFNSLYSDFVFYFLSCWEKKGFRWLVERDLKSYYKAGGNNLCDFVHSYKTLSVMHRLTSDSTSFSQIRQADSEGVLLRPDWNGRQGRVEARFRRPAGDLMRHKRRSWTHPGQSLTPLGASTQRNIWAWAEAPALWSVNHHPLMMSPPPGARWQDFTLADWDYRENILMHSWRTAVSITELYITSR